MTDLSPCCRRCGAAAGDDVVVRHAESDPLQVSECARCGSIIGVGGHRW